MYLLNLGITLESQLVLVIDIGELTFRHVDSTFGDVIHLTFLKHLVESFNLFIEPRGTDLAGFVEKGDRKKSAFTLRVVPCFDPRLRGDTGLDGPLVLVRRESFNGVDTVLTSSSRAAGTSQGALEIGSQPQRSETYVLGF